MNKRFTPGPEDQISFTGRTPRAQHIKGEYLFEIHVKSENRTFEVPVDENTYGAMRVGNSFTFQRPPSEQAK